MRVSTSLAWLLTASALSQAAPPVVTVPKEVTGDVGAFVAVRTSVTEAKAVKFVSLDAGLNLFPADLLSDKTATVVTSAKAGRYRLLCYSGNTDGPSEPALTTVIIGTPTPEPPLPPGPKPPPVDPSPTEVLYFAIVRPDQATADLAAVMRLPAWDELRAKGHLVKDIPISELPQGLTPPVTLPGLMVLKRNLDGKTFTDTKQNKPVPTTDDAIRGLLK